MEVCVIRDCMTAACQSLLNWSVWTVCALLHHAHVQLTQVTRYEHTCTHHDRYMHACTRTDMHTHARTRTHTHTHSAAHAHAHAHAHAVSRTRTQ